MSPSSAGSSPARSNAPVNVRELRPSDRVPLTELLRATGAFDEHEIAIALELIDRGLAPDNIDYFFKVAEDETNRVVGYACYGLAPLTDGVYDLYWIAVHPKSQGKKVGRLLIRAVEQAVREIGGRMLLIETASKVEYQPTRAFYERSGYHEIARIPDFYRLGDDKIIYRKVFDTKT
jgi:ribosomal protein S18 acetylase RimI-like enzyme